MKFLIINVFDGGEHCGASFKDVNDLTVQSKIDYCKKYGYDFLNIDKNLDETRIISWSKTKATIENLDKYDWIWCTDADLIIMNDSIMLEDLIDDKFDIIVARNHHTQNEEIEINTGSILIKNSDWTKNFLNNVYAQNQFSLDGWAEQRAMMHLLKIDITIKEHFKFVDFRLFNSLYKCWDEYNYKIGDFTLHLAGRGNLERLYILQSINKFGNNKKWHINSLKKDGELSIYGKLLHTENPYSIINDCDLTENFFKNIKLCSGGDAVNLIVMSNWSFENVILIAKYLKSINEIHTDVIYLQNDIENYKLFIKEVKNKELEDYIIPFYSQESLSEFLYKKDIKAEIIFSNIEKTTNLSQELLICLNSIKNGGILLGKIFKNTNDQAILLQFCSNKNIQLMMYEKIWMIKK